MLHIYLEGFRDVIRNNPVDSSLDTQLYIFLAVDRPSVNLTVMRFDSSDETPARRRDKRRLEHIKADIRNLQELAAISHGEADVGNRKSREVFIAEWYVLCLLIISGLRAG